MLPLLFGGFGSLVGGLPPADCREAGVAFCGFLATAILLFAFTRIQAVIPAMVVMGMASFASDLTMPISWDACVEIGGAYTATVAAAMNMLGNLGGFVAPVVGGMILQRMGTGTAVESADRLHGGSGGGFGSVLALSGSGIRARRKRAQRLNIASEMN